MEVYITNGDKRQTVMVEMGYRNLELRESSYQAEFSVAKFLGFSKPNPPGTYEGADIGFWTQVRWMRRGPHLLIPKPAKPKRRDPRSYVYCLVLGVPQKFLLRGWIGGDLIFNRETVVLKPGYPQTFMVRDSELNQDWEHLKLIAKSSLISGRA